MYVIDGPSVYLWKRGSTWWLQW